MSPELKFKTAKVPATLCNAQLPPAPALLTPSRLLVVGCGPAARQNYLPYLRENIGKELEEIALLVELESMKVSVESFLRGTSIEPKQKLWLPESSRFATDLSPELIIRLDREIEAGHINGALILTEPKAHLPYVRWALSRSLPVLVEKPLSAPLNACCDTTAAQTLWADYLEVANLLTRYPKSSITLMAQRRSHSGFQFVMNSLRDFARNSGVPLTFVDVFKSDGLWTFPHEYDKENHPFKYGYGMLLHGGYHFIDLVAAALQAGSVPGKEHDNFLTSASLCWPKDSLKQIQGNDYARLFPGYLPPPLPDSNFGELDVHALFNFRRGVDSVAHGKISIMHNGFSRRAWPESKADPYKGNGRLRHERLHVVAGPLLSLMVHSYEAFEQRNFHDQEAPLPGAPGGHNHFEIQIFRNAEVIGGKPFESFSMSDNEAASTSSYIQRARQEILSAYLRGCASTSWESYRLTFQLLSEIALCAARAYHGRPGISEFIGSATSQP